MLTPLTIVILIAVVALVLVALYYLLRRRLLDDRLLLVAGVLELALVVQLVVGIVNVAGTSRHIETALFIGYLIGVLVVPPAAAIMGIIEKSRWGMGVVIVGALVVAVLEARLHQVWNGGGI